MNLPKSIAFVGLSGAIADHAQLDRAATYFNSHGLSVSSPEATWARHQRFAGTDEERLDALHTVVADRSIDIVMSARGGYGLSRLLHKIKWKQLAKSGKQFVGYSDFTALNLGLLAQTGAISWQGPSAVSFGGQEINSVTEEHFWTALSSDVFDVSVKAAKQPKVDVTGTLWGGNLAMIGSLLGTPYMPDIRKGILFLEDVGEHPYKVERLLWQLHHAGILDKQRAIVLAEFNDYKLTANDKGYDFDVMVDYMRKQIKTPILTGLAHGHGASQLTLPVGAKASLVSQRGGYSLSVSVK